MKLCQKFAQWREASNANSGAMVVIVFFGTLLVMMLGVVVFGVYKTIFPTNAYLYEASYIDKNQTVYERQYNPKQHEYRINVYETIKQANGSSKWKYEKTIDYSKTRPKVAYLRKVSGDEFDKMLDAKD